MRTVRSECLEHFVISLSSLCRSRARPAAADIALIPRISGQNPSGVRTGSPRSWRSGSVFVTRRAQSGAMVGRREPRGGQTWKTFIKTARFHDDDQGRGPDDAPLALGIANDERGRG